MYWNQAPYTVDLIFKALLIISVYQFIIDKLYQFILIISVYEISVIGKSKDRKQIHGSKGWVKGGMRNNCLVMGVLGGSDENVSELFW